MITDLYFHCALQGENFDPTPFLTSAQFEVLNYHRIGDIAEKGRFKGQAHNDGYVSFKAKTGDFDEFVHRLYAEKPLIVESHAERRELHLFLGYQGQCNWDFPPDVLRMIGELGLTLTMSCDKFDNPVNT